MATRFGEGTVQRLSFDELAGAGGLRGSNHEEISLMAVPKRRMSRSNTRSRRAQWKATEPGLVTVSVGGRQHKVPRRLLKAARLGLIDLDKR
jgi:large subunit ribosomal protein L32